MSSTTSTIQITRLGVVASSLNRGPRGPDKHLFADINLKTAENLKSWKGTFPDPSTPSGYYTKTLSISLFHGAMMKPGGTGMRCKRLG